MRSSSLDKGLRTGVVFGIVILTMVLIGFTVTGAGLVGKLFGASSSYSTPPLAYFVIFMILIGGWAGSQRFNSLSDRARHVEACSHRWDRSRSRQRIVRRCDRFSLWNIDRRQS
ncbi:MAG: hypothetical protein QM730_15610 [Anaerolineales bacterium]